MGDLKSALIKENNTSQSKLRTNLPQNKSIQLSKLSDKTLIILSVIIFLLFAISFIFSFQSPLNFPPTGIWTLPFILISIFPTIPAWLIGGLTCYRASLDLFKCNNQLIYILYFVFSALYSLIFLFLAKSIVNKRGKGS